MHGPSSLPDTAKRPAGSATMLKEAFNKEKSNEQDAGDTFRDIREDAVGTYQTTTEKMEGRPTVFT